MSFFDKFKKKSNVVELLMPVEGEVIKLEKVADPVFSGKMMGDGFAITPTSGKVYAPCDATVVTVFPTGHAYGLSVGENVEILIHIGLDTVNLKGEGFSAKVTENQVVKKGDLLCEFDLELITEKCPSIQTPVIFTKLENTTFEVEYKNFEQGAVIGNLK